MKAHGLRRRAAIKRALHILGEKRIARRHAKNRYRERLGWTHGTYTALGYLKRILEPDEFKALLH